MSRERLILHALALLMCSMFYVLIIESKNLRCMKSLDFKQEGISNKELVQ